MVVGCEANKGGENWAPAAKAQIAPLVGEMPGRAEGGAKDLGLAYLLAQR